MKNQFVPYTVKTPGVVLPLSFEQAEKLLGKEAMEKGEKRFEIETRGPWGIVSKVSAIAMSVKGEEVFGSFRATERTIYGMRSLSNPKQLGYDMEGKVSINGTKRRAFTSSVLIELPDKRLINCAILYVCAE